jgi:hypothetical protein
MLKGHHGVCGERGEGRETDRLGIEQTSVAMSRHVAGDTDGRNSAGRRSFDCLQSPPRPSLAHRRRTRLGAAARRTVRVSQSCWGFRGLLDAGRESVPHLRRRPTPSRGSGRRNLNPDRTPSQHRPPPPPLSPGLSRPVEDCPGCPGACWSSQSWSGRSQRRLSRFTLQFRRPTHPGVSSGCTTQPIPSSGARRLSF